MQAYYPHQEFADSTVKGYLFDFERLAVMHGLDHVRAALLNLRITAGQKFFPHPSEVAEEIERMKEAARPSQAEVMARETKARMEEQESWFWTWVDEQLAEPRNEGVSEQEFLDRVKVPGYIGRKARSTNHAA